ncbi:MAG TPA: tetratricopeptide repeat protein [Polyangiaceae bacterium]|jgi:TolA-binding protein|nr:tetratricopeptide repeat protein [Polyangiaceae bacterium]
MSRDFEELSARARRERLPDEEAQALSQRLAESEEARLWHGAGRAFDAEDVVLPGDAAAAERVRTRLLRELPVKKANARARPALLLIAAALLLATAAAAAAFEVRSARRGAHSEVASGARSVAAPARVATGQPATVVESESAVSHDLAPVNPSASVAPAPIVEETPPASVESASTSAAANVAGRAVTAGELMSAAGRARRQGYSRQAIALLNQLQVQFPNSPEARASEVSLGMLELRNGLSAGARSHFERYLARTPRGALAADALWGKAQTQFAAGDSVGARQTLTALLAEFPNSAYSSAAQVKLNAR